MPEHEEWAERPLDTFTRRQHVLGSVAVLEAGEDHAVLRAIDIGRHVRIIHG